MYTRRRDGYLARMVVRVLLLSFLAVIVAAPVARAADVRLPLDGYCRPGRFFPADVRGTNGSTVTLTADGCLPSDVSADGVAPVLAVDPAGDLRWPGGGRRLRVPRSDERLVGAVTPAAVPPDLFPGNRVVFLPLDPADPLPGPPAAWETLDAVVLDAPTMRRLTDPQRSALLAGGVALVATGAPPDDRWPWHRRGGWRGGWWTLACAVRGPTDAVVAPDAFSPTYTWVPGWPAPVRRAAFAVASLVALATVAVCLVRRPWAVWAAVGLCVAAAAGITLWRRSLGTVAVAGGDVTAAADGLVQRDAWVYERARSPGTPATVPWGGWAHPAFESSSDLARAAPRVIVAADGKPSFAVTLGVVAFVHRDVGPGTNAAGDGTASPMRDVARDLYLRVGDRLGGDVRPTAGRWAGVTVEGGP